MNYVSLQKQCYQESVQAMVESDVFDQKWKDWIVEQDFSPPEEYRDPIDFIALQIQKIYPGPFSHIKKVLEISDAMNRVTGAMIPQIQFSTKLLNPTVFYENNPDIKELCASLLCPISFAEGREAVGIIAINPVAARIVEEQLTAHIQDRYKIGPYVSCTMASSRGGWAQVCDKHFESNLTTEIV